MAPRVDVGGISALVPSCLSLPVFAHLPMSTPGLLLRRHSVLPGFNLALGFALLYLSLIHI